MKQKIVWFSVEEILKTWKSTDIGYVPRKNKKLTDMENVIRTKRKSVGFRELKNSLKKDGLKKPGKFYIDDDGNPTHYDGHHRFTALYDLGYKFLPYIEIDNDEDSLLDSLDGDEWTSFNESIDHKRAYSKIEKLPALVCPL